MPSLILIPQWAKSDPAYLAHEQCHVAQQRKHGVFTFWLRYLSDSLFRQAMEVESYRAQIKSGTSLSYCAQQLYLGYNLGLEYMDCVKLLEV